MKGKRGGGQSGRSPGRRPAPAGPAPPASRPLALRAGELALWLLVLVPPLVIFPSAKESFRLPKLMVSEWLALASLLALALAPALGPRAVSMRPAALPRSLALRAAAPLVGVALCGLAVTRHPLHLREGLADLAIGSACLVGWSVSPEADRLLRLLGGLLWPAAALALLGILQFHGLYQPLRFLGLAAGSRLAVTSLAGNPGDLAAYLVLPALLAQWRLARSPAGPGRWALAAVLAVCVYALAATQTLAALAALALGSAVFWGVGWAMRSPLRRRRAAVAAAAALGGAAVLAVVLVATLPPLRARVATKAQQMRAGDWNAALSGRLDGWRAATFMLSEHPLAGVGQGAFRAEFAPAKLALLARGVAFYPDQPNASFANAHNELLEVGADLGWPGLAALVWGIGMLFVALRRLGAGARERGEPAALAWAGTAALAVLALAQFPFRIALVAFPALLFLAWIFRAAAEAPEAPAAREAPEPGPAPAGRRAGLAGALAALLAAGLVGQTLRADRRIAASRLLGTVEALSIAAAAGRAPAGLLGANLAMLDRAARLDPVEVEVPLARGGQFLLFGRPEAALGPYRRALALEPHPEIYLDLSRAYLAAGDAEQARANLDLALRLSPWLRSAAPPGLSPS